MLGQVPYEDMPGLYSLADFRLYPSLLEAFHCGCPILTSNITSIPEVAGVAAYLVDPYDIDQIANGMMKLSTDPMLCQMLIARGHKQAKKFSWERTARIILTALEQDI